MPQWRVLFGPGSSWLPADSISLLGVAVNEKLCDGWLAVCETSEEDVPKAELKYQGKTDVSLLQDPTIVS